MKRYLTTEAQRTQRELDRMVGMPATTERSQNSQEMERVHNMVLRLRHWQVFLAVLCMIAVFGYPLYILGRNMLGWEMPFKDSPAPGIILYVCSALWFDVTLSTSAMLKDLRLLSALFMALFAGAVLWLRQDRPSPAFVYILPLYVLGALWVIKVVLPTARAINGSRVNALPYWLDVLLVAVWFPFGLWAIQPRLNALDPVQHK